MPPAENAGQVSSSSDVASRPMTFGEKAVGLSFNPSGDPAVQLCKEAYATIIDNLNDLRTTTVAPSQDKARLIAIAITEAQAAQMWAVKAITCQY